MKELFEIGFFTAFYNSSNWILTAAVYFCVLVGFFIQLLILRKSKPKTAKWIYPAILLFACVISEVLTWTITDWDLFAVLIVYGLVISNAIGVVIAGVVYQIRRKNA